MSTVLVTCLVCGQRKQPRGRSAPLGAYYCHPSECEGYDQDPQPGTIWDDEVGPMQPPTSYETAFADAMILRGLLKRALSNDPEWRNDARVYLREKLTP